MAIILDGKIVGFDVAGFMSARPFPIADDFPREPNFLCREVDKPADEPIVTAPSDTLVNDSPGIGLDFLVLRSEREHLGGRRGFAEYRAPRHKKGEPHSGYALQGE